MSWVAAYELLKTVVQGVSGLPTPISSVANPDEIPQGTVGTYLAPQYPTWTANYGEKARRPYHPVGSGSLILLELWVPKAQLPAGKTDPILQLGILAERIKTALETATANGTLDPAGAPGVAAMLVEATFDYAAQEDLGWLACVIELRGFFV